MIPVCPACDKALILFDCMDTELDYCHVCKGLWLDSGELEDIILRTGARTGDPLVDFLEADTPRPAGKLLLCPRCDSEMAEIIKNCADGQQLVVDRCRKGHGIWFDANELQKLLGSFPPECGTGSTVQYLNAMLGGSNTKLEAS